jgi:hypothetical protein
MFSIGSFEISDEDARAFRDQLNTQYPPEEDKGLWSVERIGENTWIVERDGNCAAHVYTKAMALRIAELLNSREELA